MQPGHTLIDPPRPDHAVLSHRPLQHRDDLPKLNWTSFNQANQHTEVSKKGLDLRGDRAGQFQRPRTLVSPSVERLLLHLALGLLVVSDAAPGRLLLPVNLATSKGTAQVTPPRITWVGEEKNPAVPASRQALSQPGPGPQNRSQHHVICQHQGRDCRLAIPLRIEPEMCCDLGCKQPRLSL
jgi:hypothetical protein